MADEAMRSARRRKSAGLEPLQGVPISKSLKEEEPGEHVECK